MSGQVDETTCPQMHNTETVTVRFGPQFLHLEVEGSGQESC